ncbi:membrane protein of unknown function [Methylorubrum extorquens]|uniref:Cation efflux protein transmembrane domain-containing protein n=1 Tax=Methylorubrum extorquens TaxID=408 RepID=A0A2N9AQ67_METEX|nr:membrane protein of unknown function [Methylorubrum extorquens]
MSRMTGTEKAALASAAVGVLVTALKFTAYWLTGSLALYSDALESIINVVAAACAFLAVRVAAQPADEDHPYGHHKAEYFSAVIEGALVIVAALLILREAYFGILDPKPPRRARARSGRQRRRHHHQRGLGNAAVPARPAAALARPVGRCPPHPRRRRDVGRRTPRSRLRPGHGNAGARSGRSGLGGPQHPLVGLDDGARFDQRLDGSGGLTRDGHAHSRPNLGSQRGRPGGPRRAHPPCRQRHLHRLPSRRARRDDRVRIPRDLRPAGGCDRSGDRGRGRGDPCRAGRSGQAARRARDLKPASGAISGLA